MLNALRKARTAARRRGHRAGELVLGADTLVTLDGAISASPAIARQPSPCSAVCRVARTRCSPGVALLRGGACELFAVATRVTFKPMNGPAIAEYVTLIVPLDKAGAYAAQEHGDRINFRDQRQLVQT